MNRYETLAVRCAGLALAAALTLNGEMLRAQTAAGAAEAGGTVANGNNTAATNNTSPKSDNTTPAPDPREGLKPGWYDAGEASLGMEHLVFLKKPDAFQPPASKPTDSPMQKMFAQLGFANSDLPTRISRLREPRCSRGISTGSTSTTSPIRGRRH
jgi:hypothetical protein